MIFLYLNFRVIFIINNEINFWIKSKGIFYIETYEQDERSHSWKASSFKANPSKTWRQGHSRSTFFIRLLWIKLWEACVAWWVSSTIFLNWMQMKVSVSEDFLFLSATEFYPKLKKKELLSLYLRPCYGCSSLDKLPLIKKLVILLLISPLGTYFFNWYSVS